MNDYEMQPYCCPNCGSHEFEPGKTCRHCQGAGQAWNKTQAQQQHMSQTIPAKGQGFDSSRIYQEAVQHMRENGNRYLDSPAPRYAAASYYSRKKPQKKAAKNKAKKKMVSKAKQAPKAPARTPSATQPPAKHEVSRKSPPERETFNWNPVPPKKSAKTDARRWVPLTIMSEPGLTSPRTPALKSVVDVLDDILKRNSS